MNPTIKKKLRWCMLRKTYMVYDKKEIAHVFLRDKINLYDGVSLR